MPKVQFIKGYRKWKIGDVESFNSRSFVWLIDNGYCIKFEEQKSLIPKQLHNPEFRFVLLGKWNEWGRYDNKEINGKLKSVCVEKRFFESKDYAKLDKEKIWKPLGKAPFEPSWQKNGYEFDNP